MKSFLILSLLVVIAQAEVVNVQGGNLFDEKTRRRANKNKKKKQQVDSSSYAHLEQAQKRAIDGAKTGKKTLNMEDLGSFFNVLKGAGEQKKDGSCPNSCAPSRRDNSTIPKELHGQTLYSVPKKNIRPYSNGCSVPDMFKDEIGDYSMFESCCDLHDTCYSSCGIHKPDCENDFKKCLDSVCHNLNQEPTTSSTEQKRCSDMSKMFVAGTSVFGCSGYGELQAEHCDCVPREEAATRTKEYLHAFYNHYNGTSTLSKKFVDKFVNEFDPKTKQQKDEAHFQRDLGTAIYALYRKYPESIDIISRDGSSGRKHAVLFGDGDVPRSSSDSRRLSGDKATIDQELDSIEKEIMEEMMAEAAARESRSAASSQGGEL